MIIFEYKRWVGLRYKHVLEFREKRTQNNMTSEHNIFESSLQTLTLNDISKINSLKNHNSRLVL